MLAALVLVVASKSFKWLAMSMMFGSDFHFRQWPQEAPKYIRIKVRQAVMQAAVTEMKRVRGDGEEQGKEEKEEETNQGMDEWVKIMDECVGRIASDEAAANEDDGSGGGRRRGRDRDMSELVVWITADCLMPIAAEVKIAFWKRALAEVRRAKQEIMEGGDGGGSRKDGEDADTTREARRHKSVCWMRAAMYLGIMAYVDGRQKKGLEQFMVEEKEAVRETLDHMDEMRVRGVYVGRGGRDTERVIAELHQSMFPFHPPC